MKKIIKLAGGLFFFYLLLIILMYFFQENLIFHPEKLDKDHVFNFENSHEELFVETADDIKLNGILFKSDSSKGLIFYLHGNAGSLERWGRIAKKYTDLNYDLFMIDYRGYGKSEGSITNEKQFYQDVQATYDEVSSKYSEDSIIILGYSIGTGPAAKLASENNPKLLILQAPYYSLTDMMEYYYPVIPTAILKYNFSTYKYLPKVKAPIIIFHGDRDEVIYYASSLKLKAYFDNGDTLITLEGQRHNGMSDNPLYLEALKDILKTNNH